MSRRKIIIPALLAILMLLLLSAPALATGEAVTAFKGNKFIELTIFNAVFLFIVGFIGGLVSGFIGSGGAFVLTPAMMSLGVPGLVAVASNMCHKFPKALVGAIKRHKYGQVDLKLGLTLGISASVGVELGIKIQKYIQHMWGEAGSNLYVSFAFLVILITVGSYVFYDAWKTKKQTGPAPQPRLALALQKLNIPPMMHFKTANLKISMWITVPVGLATGLLAATIAVGGFIGVPGMMYVIGASSLVASATELVIAFVMGFVGSTEWALVGNIDIRLVLLILAGSLFGVQLGALGTTYVKDYMIKVVMGTIMLIVAFSRGFAIPKYTNQLGLTSISKDLVPTLSSISFYIMAFALALGATIILGSMIKAMRHKPAVKPEPVRGLEKAVN
ncbi:MAG: sulfite exporter TauE/SafE family protein [Firmicutes bacterium]|nr:sulfite exporter TauE/SafE family protein [Bacillota bacterium]